MPIPLISFSVCSTHAGGVLEVSVYSVVEVVQHSEVVVISDLCRARVLLACAVGNEQLTLARARCSEATPGTSRMRMPARFFTPRRRWGWCTCTRSTNRQPRTRISTKVNEQEPVQ